MRVGLWGIGDFGVAYFIPTVRRMSQVILQEIKLVTPTTYVVIVIFFLLISNRCT